MARWNLALLTALALGTTMAAQHRAEQRDMALVGYSDLQARSAYQPTIHRQGTRWIAYIGHHGGVQRNPITGMDEQNGTSVVDVTDPRRPRYLAHIPGEAGQGEAGGAQMARVCSGTTLPRADKSKVYLLRSFGNWLMRSGTSRIPQSRRACSCWWRASRTRTRISGNATRALRM